MRPSVPVIDISPLAGPGSAGDLDRTVEQIASACRDWGFFQVLGHGVSDALLEAVWRETQGFFDLPRAVKHAVARSAENPRGYYDRELTKNVRDLKEVFDFGSGSQALVDGKNQWPESLPDFRGTMVEFFNACEGVGQRVFEGFCLGLGLPRTALAPEFVDHTSFVRLNYYPLTDPLAPDEAADVTDLGGMALHHHTDAGALTILLQDDVGGLQVYGADEWIDVEPIRGAFVVNIGDMTQVWSNDRYRAALHRVRPMKNRARYSLPFFYNPSYETDCAPLSTSSAAPPRYRTINWGEFRRARTAGDYADHGKEIQIADFLID